MSADMRLGRGKRSRLGPPRVAYYTNRQRTPNEIAGQAVKRRLIDALGPAEESYINELVQEMEDFPQLRHLSAPVVAQALLYINDHPSIVDYRDPETQRLTAERLSSELPGLDTVFNYSLVQPYADAAILGVGRSLRSQEHSGEETRLKMSVELLRYIDLILEFRGQVQRELDRRAELDAPDQ